jgi:hypothetical protein
MKKLPKWLLISLVLLGLNALPVAAQQDVRPVNLYYFYAEGCSTCAALDVYLDELLNEDPSLTLHRYELAFNAENQALARAIGEVLNQRIVLTPSLIIGREVLVGFTSESPATIEDTIAFVRDNNVRDVVGELLGLVTPGQGVDLVRSDGRVRVPILGEIDARAVSLPLLAIVLGGLDGFNPCAMWVLLLLISMLFHLEHQWKKWFLGGLFLATTFVMYFMFMISWLSIAILFGTLVYLRWLIGGLAIGGGLFNFKRYRELEPGCELVDDQKRGKLRDRLIAIQNQPSLWLAALGIVVMAVSVNLVELVCSAGIPVLFTQILSLNALTQGEYLMYILLYMAMFILDDTIVFIVAMKTAELTGLSTKYGRVAHLIGAFLMVSLGLLMIFRPEWLMLSF